VRKLQGFLSPPNLEDQLRALAAIWRGQAMDARSVAIGMKWAEAKERWIGRSRAFDEASSDLEALVDRFEKERR
jgi:hypothetical protein